MGAWLFNTITGHIPPEQYRPLVKRKALWGKSDGELRAILRCYCRVRGGPLADQIETLPFQSRIDEIQDIFEARRTYGAKQHAVLVEWGRLPVELVESVALCLDAPFSLGQPRNKTK